MGSSEQLRNDDDDDTTGHARASRHGGEEHRKCCLSARSERDTRLLILVCVWCVSLVFFADDVCACVCVEGEEMAKWLMVDVVRRRNQC